MIESPTTAPRRTAALSEPVVRGGAGGCFGVSHRVHLAPYGTRGPRRAYGSGRSAPGPWVPRRPARARRPVSATRRAAGIRAGGGRRRRFRPASTRYTIPTPNRSQWRMSLGQHGAEHELGDEQREQAPGFTDADAAVGEHRDGERGLRRGEEQLLALQLVEGQARASRRRRSTNTSGSVPTSSVHWLTFDDTSVPRPAVRVQAPGEQARDEQLGCLRRQRREPLHEQERADAELPARRRRATRRTARRTTRMTTAA